MPDYDYSKTIGSLDKLIRSWDEDAKLVNGAKRVGEKLFVPVELFGALQCMVYQPNGEIGGWSLCEPKQAVDECASKVQVKCGCCPFNHTK